MNFFIQGNIYWATPKQAKTCRTHFIHHVNTRIRLNSHSPPLQTHFAQRNFYGAVVRTTHKPAINQINHTLFGQQLYLLLQLQRIYRRLGLLLTALQPYALLSLTFSTFSFAFPADCTCVIAAYATTETSRYTNNSSVMRYMSCGSIKHTRKRFLIQ